MSSYRTKKPQSKSKQPGPKPARSAYLNFTGQVQVDDYGHVSAVMSFGDYFTITSVPSVLLGGTELSTMVRYGNTVVNKFGEAAAHDANKELRAALDAVLAKEKSMPRRRRTYDLRY